MDLAALFSQHVERLQVETEKALADTGFASLVVSSGAPFTYFADDRDAPFEPVAALRALVPARRAAPPAARRPRAAGRASSATRRRTTGTSRAG